jgi:hypothetical protein
MQQTFCSLGMIFHQMIVDHAANPGIRWTTLLLGLMTGTFTATQEMRLPNSKPCTNLQNITNVGVTHVKITVKHGRALWAP